MTLTTEQQACNYQTMLHISRVKNLLDNVVVKLLERGRDHDASKLESPEVELFTEWSPKLKTLKYGSKEYEECRQNLGPALEHHYSRNRHHPEFHKDGVDDMTLLDLLEMLVDWKASSERQNDGNIRKSIEINTKRFGLSSQLVRILENTVGELF
jgi:hypothetical protein